MKKEPNFLKMMWICFAAQIITFFSPSFIAWGIATFTGGASDEIRKTILGPTSPFTIIKIGVGILLGILVIVFLVCHLVNKSNNKTTTQVAQPVQPVQPVQPIEQSISVEQTSPQDNINQ